MHRKHIAATGMPIIASELGPSGREITLLMTMVGGEGVVVHPTTTAVRDRILMPRKTICSFVTRPKAATVNVSV